MRWPCTHALQAVVQALGGLGVIATVHVGVAWAFVAFVVMHVYLTTTGRSPLSHLKSMVVGYSDHAPSEPGDPP